MPTKSAEEKVTHKTSETSQAASAKSAAERSKTEQQAEAEDQGIFPDVHTLLAWHAPGRPYRKRTRDFYINSLLILMALEVIFFLFSQYLLMLVALSVAFLAFALSVTPPAQLYYRISTQGIAMDDHFYLWQELYDFYFMEKHGVTTLHIRTKAYLPGELIILPGDVPKDHLKQALLVFLPYREVVKLTFTEKAADWVVKSFPLEKTPHHS